MYHNFVLVQKIDENASLKVYFASQQYINWTYETSKRSNSKTDSPLFPIVITDANCIIQEKSKGNETQCFKTSENTIRFIDDYGVPDGFLICVTGPSGYLPSLVKYGNKPSVGFNHINPGILDFYVNSVTKQASVIVHTTQRSLFSMIIDFAKYDGSFNTRNRTSYYDTFDFTLALNAERFEFVNTTQVNEVLTDLSGIQSEEIASAINELVEFLRSNSDERIPARITSRISNVCSSIITTSSAAVTILDSYANHGSVGYMLKSLIEFFN